MNSEKALLTREQSSAVKGFLMLLIMLGHNSVAMDNMVTHDGFTFKWWLYSFHVICFMVLPFMYGYKKLSAERLKNNFARLYIPYIWIFIVCAAIYILTTTRHFEPVIQYLYAFFWGNEPLLKRTIGFNFPWFLPAMFSLLVFKDLYYWGKANKKAVSITIISVAAIMWLAMIAGFTDRNSLGDYIPFAISQGLIYFIVALITRAIIEKAYAKKDGPLHIAISLIFFAALSVCFYYKGFLPGYMQRTLPLVMPVAAFTFIYSLKGYLGKSRFLRFVGDNSMVIYLSHVIIYNALLRITLRINPGMAVLWLAISTYLLTFGISAALAVLLKRAPGLYRKLFPRSVDDLKFG